LVAAYLDKKESEGLQASFMSNRALTISMRMSAVFCEILFHIGVCLVCVFDRCVGASLLTVRLLVGNANELSTRRAKSRRNYNAPCEWMDDWFASSAEPTEWIISACLLVPLDTNACGRENLSLISNLVVYERMLVNE